MVLSKSDVLIMTHTVYGDGKAMHQDQNSFAEFASKQLVDKIVNVLPLVVDTTHSTERAQNRLIGELTVRVVMLRNGAHTCMMHR